MVFFAFSLPRPRSQRFPVMNLRPPLKWLMVRRQVFVHPRHFVIVVEYSMSLISSMESMVVPSQVCIPLAGDEGRAEGAHDAGDIRTDGFAVSDLLEAAEDGVIVKGAALYDDVVSEFGSA